MATLLAMIFTAMAFVLSMGFLAAQETSEQVARNIHNRAKARMLAESGLQTAMGYVMGDPAWRTAKQPGTWVRGASYAGGTVTITAQDGCDTNGDGKIDGGNSDFSDSTHPVTLTCTGTFNGAQSVASVVLTPVRGRIASGLTAIGGIDLNNSAVDSYDSSLGAYGGTNVGSDARLTTNSITSGTVSLDHGSRVNGGVSVGEGGDPATAISLKGSSTITGARDALSDNVQPPVITVPDVGPQQGSMDFSGAGTTTITGDLHVSSLHIRHGNVVQISGNVTIVSEGNIRIESGGRIEVLPGSSLKVYSKADLRIETHADNTVDGPNLSRLTFYHYGNAPVYLKSGSLQGVLIAPNAPVRVDHGFQMYGAIFSESLKVEGDSRLHEDIHLTRGDDELDLPGTVSGYNVRW